MNINNFIYLLTENENVQLYINNGKFFLPTCINISKIYVKENEKNLSCTQFPEVFFDSPYSSKKVKGYIRFNNILTEQASHIACTLRKTSMIIDADNGKYFNFLLSGPSQTVREFVPHQVDLKLNSLNLKNNFDHHYLLFNGSDFYEQINEYLNPLTNSRSIELFSKIENERKKKFSNERSSNWSFKTIESLLTNYLNLFKQYFIYFIFFFIILVILIFSFKVK